MFIFECSCSSISKYPFAAIGGLRSAFLRFSRHFKLFSLRDIHNVVDFFMGWNKGSDD